MGSVVCGWLTLPNHLHTRQTLVGKGESAISKSEIFFIETSRTNEKPSHKWNSSRNETAKVSPSLDSRMPVFSNVARSHGSRNQVKCRYQKDHGQLCLPWSGSMPPRLRSSSSDSEFFKGSLNILPCARYSSSSEWSSSTWSCKSWSLKTNTSLTWDTKSSSNKKNR